MECLYQWNRVLNTATAKVVFNPTARVGFRRSAPHEEARGRHGSSGSFAAEGRHTRTRTRTGDARAQDTADRLRLQFPKKGRQCGGPTRAYSCAHSCSGSGATAGYSPGVGPGYLLSSAPPFGSSLCRPCEIVSDDGRGGLWRTLNMWKLMDMAESKSSIGRKMPWTCGQRPS